MPVNIRYTLLTILVSLLMMQASAQVGHIRSYLGAMYYQGDLSPKPLDISFGPGNFCYGFAAGLNATDWLSINTRFMMGRLTGDDAYADNPQRRLRNLSFSSPLYEYGLFTDLKINKLWKGLNKYKLKLYLTFGINYIHFDPHAFYNNQWVRLQPLGTEGQTLKDSPVKPYNLNNWSRPVGLIIEIDFSKRVSLGMEFSTRKTYTDYIDDVSGSYGDYMKMVADGNILGANLSNRTGEYLNTAPVMLPAGTPRGRSDKNDWYSFFGVYLKYNIGKIASPPTFHLPDDSITEEELKG